MLRSRSERRKVVWATAASIAIHLLLVTGAGIAMMMEWEEPEPEPEEEKSIELTFVPEKPEVQPPPVLPPPPEKKFVRTPEELLANKEIDDALFESDKDTQAASELPPEGDASVPSQDGIDRPELNLESTPYTPGDSAAASLPALPSLPQMAVAPRPTPKQELQEAAPTPPPPATSMPILAPTPTPTPEPEEKKESEPDQQPPQPEMVASDPSVPGYQQQQQQNKIRGNIDNRGRSSVRAKGTPLGKYYKILQDAIGSRWYFYTSSKMDLLSVGSVKVLFYVEKDGSVDDLRVVSNNSNDYFATCTVQSVLEAEIPPIPEDVAANLESNRLEVTFTFTLY